jgi:hypothetical protein
MLDYQKDLSIEDYYPIRQVLVLDDQPAKLAFPTIYAGP